MKEGTFGPKVQGKRSKQRRQLPEDQELMNHHYLDHSKDHDVLVIRMRVEMDPSYHTDQR